MTAPCGRASLRIKLLAIVLPGIILVLMSVFAVLESQNHAERLAQLRERLVRFAQSSAVVLAQPVWTYDDALLKDFISVMMAHPEFKGLIVLDADTQILATGGDVSAMESDLDFVVSEPITYYEGEKAHRVGFLRVAFDQHVIDAEVRSTVKRYAITGVALVVLMTLIIWVATDRLIFVPLERLRQAMLANQDKSGTRHVDWTSGDELGEVIRTYNLMESRRKELEYSRSKMIELGILMGSERNAKRLIETLLMAAKDIHGADGGTVYVLDPDREELTFGIILNQSLGIRLGGETGDDIPFPPLKLRNPDGTENHSQLATHAALTGNVINIPDAYDSALFDFTGPKRFDEANGYRSMSFLVIPLRNRQGQVTGVLQLINASDPETGEVIPFDESKIPVVESMAVQAGVALEVQLLIEAQRDLLDSFIELIASAIDAKSAYTGGHCARVPEIARMLTEAACAETEGPFALFDLTDEEWRELHIASWLHDCGKVTSPEYVVDKATKLETIYNRIHEVRMRFEVLWRDAEIGYRDSLLAGADPAQARARMAEEQARLLEEFAFVAKTNIGGESMDDGEIERLRAIGERTWVRHFDDRQGLSIAEEQRLEGVPRIPAPALETLLADRPNHIFHWPDGKPPLEEENRYGIRMMPPAVQYNHGEFYNLSIRRGTLTEEERYKINDHITQTIVMLENLPLPQGLKRVPEYASGHHEKMDGTGYPRGIKAGEMSVPARIMAIADIFEALTAVDRPYKTPKTISEALKIMASMVAGGHIDPDLYALFLRSGVWREYAESYLRPDQLDDVDISEYFPGKPVDDQPKAEP
ncbi:HD domain-containing phosphohydrolase [Rhodospirillum sp. A1_3_36]|uniref:HD domain-containing phosphohydrolase n=1 Tax=Rhodospirillum sp. A1_3_36 TaxID=3391666 RepID=UPI0039A73452